MVSITTTMLRTQPASASTCTSRQNGKANGESTTVPAIIKASSRRTYERTKAILELEKQYAAGNYHPIGVVFDKALGAKVWDADGCEYIDCLSAYSAVNQGHCHPRILEALVSQASRLTLPSRAFHSAELGRFAKKACTLLGFESVLTMNTGAEATETALKIARRWAYTKKGVAENQAMIFSTKNCFHGRTMAAISLASDHHPRDGFGPFVPNMGPTVTRPDGTTFQIRFNHAEDLEEALRIHGANTAAFIIEPIQGEAGIIVPDEDYLPRVSALCKEYNVLLICDEVQAGLGRTGRMLSHQHWNIHPDMITIAKALTGGTYPMSAVMTSREIMSALAPGQHGSTYSGNPLACSVASAALDVLVEENLCQRSFTLGQHFRNGLKAMSTVGEDSSRGLGGWITAVRGLGLMNAVDIDPKRSRRGRTAWHLCLLMASRGVLAKPTHEHTIRLAPPLVISKEELDRALQVIRECLLDLDEVEDIPDLSANMHGDGFVSL